MSENANDKTREILSAFADDESTSFEGKLSVRELLGSEEQRARWARYHIIGDALRGETPERIDPRFTERVMDSVGRDPVQAPGRPRDHTATGWLKPVASMAMAVSVAVVTVLGIRAFNASHDVVQGGPVVASSAPHLVSGTGSPDATNRLAAGDLSPEAQVSLDRYLARHAGYAPSRGMTPYARVVGYDMDGD